MSNVRILQDVVINNSLTASDSLYVTNNAVAKNLAVGNIGAVNPYPTKTLYVSGDTFIDGMLTVTGSANFVNTTFTTSSALSVVNNGTGPAIVGVQKGEQAIAAFYDDNNVALWVDGVASRPGHVGIGTKEPNEKLTVFGNISSSGNLLFKSLSAETASFTKSITAYEFIGIGSQLTQVFGTDNTKLPLAGGVLTGGLTGTTSTFSNKLTAAQFAPLTGITSTFKTTISSATEQVSSFVNIGYDPTLSIYQSGGFGDIVSISAENYGEVFHIRYDGNVGIKNSNPDKTLTIGGEISAHKFYGNGSELTSVTGTDSTKLPLSGGTITGALSVLSGARITGNLVINGSLTALSSATFVNTIFTTTSALSIVNTGLGPALYVRQVINAGDVASFVDNDGIEALHIGNDGYVGVKTGDPNKTLTVNGDISATGDIWANKFHGDISNGPHYFVTLRNTTSQLGSVVSDVFTYTNPGALAAVEGVTPSVGDIILFVSQSNSVQNGPWKVINVGGTGIQAVLERPSFYKGTVRNGIMFSVSKGTSSHGFIYACNASSGGGTSDIVVGTTALTITQAYARGNTNAVLFANTFTSTQTLAVGNATTAPLRFQAGTLLTTPVQHSVEWDGNFMYLTTSGANSARLTNVAFVSAPATSSSYGLSGQVAYDSSFFYVCTGTNSWLKTPLSIAGTPQSADSTKLPLSGGTLTGGLTGTSISATFYGDGGNLYNIPSQINFIFDGASNPVENGSRGYIQIPYNTKILAWTLLSNSPTTSVVQVLTSNFSNHPTYTLISGLANQPALTSDTRASSSTMTGWVTAIPADSYLQFVVTQNTAATNLTISLKCVRSS
jgi:hypothetical protein